MTETIDIAVPDIGDFKDVEVMEIIVKDGEVVAKEQALITVESDKATMDIPSPISGTIVGIHVKAGDKVSRGSLIAKAIQTVNDATPKITESASSQPMPLETHGDGAKRVDLVVIGGGPGGYSAAYRAADLGLKVAIIERFETLGGVCLNIGCIPSKALLHIAAVKEEAERLAVKGVRFGTPEIDLPALRSFKNSTVKTLTDGLSQMAKARNVIVIKGTATFSSTHRLKIALSNGGTQALDFDQCIVATGSSAVKLRTLPEDGRIVTSTGALRMDAIPKQMLVIGAGIVGLEMATVYSALGAQIDLVERLPDILAGVDPDAVSIWRKQNSHRFRHIDLNTSVTGARATARGIEVVLQGAEREPRSYDLVLQSAGRLPNSSGLGLEEIGIRRDGQGFVVVDRQMRTNLSHVFAVGDVAGGPMLAHKAVHEGHVAAEVAAGGRNSFDAKSVPSVAYTDPEIAWVGVSQHQAASEGKRVKSAIFPWAASGRAIASGASYGMTKLVFDEETDRIVGGVIVGPHAGDMIGEVCLAIEMGSDAIDIGRTIHPHPTLGETIGMAAEVFEGTCTDVPPGRRSSRSKGVSRDS
jgi:dihydrolipoamide dehydrogenase